MKDLKRPIYKLKNMAQLHAVERYIKASRGEHASILFRTIRFSNGVELSSILNMKREDAISYVDLGVVMANKTSSRMSKKRVSLTFDLEMALRDAIAASCGYDYLFSSELFGANRSSGKIEPISRQGVWKMLKEAKPALRHASLSSGIVDDASGFGAQSVINFEQGDAMLGMLMTKLVAGFSDRISPDLLVALKDEIEAVNKGKLSK